MIMEYKDIINGIFELLSSLFVLNHCRVLLRDKAVKGVSALSTMFFVLWGCWNVFYYPSLGQAFSGYCGIAVTVSNAIWVSLMIRYKEPISQQSEALTYNYEMVR